MALLESQLGILLIHIANFSLRSYIKILNEAMGHNLYVCYASLVPN